MGIQRLHSSRISRRAAVDPLEPRRLLAATYPFGGSTTASVTDADGTVARFSLTAGQGDVTVADDGSWHVSVSQSTAASSLTLTTKGGNNRVSLAEFSAAKPLGTFNASAAGLSGSLSFSSVRTVTLGKATNLSLTSNSPIATLTAAAWTDSDGQDNDTLTAPSVSTLNVAGNFAADLTLTSKKLALGTATVSGTVTGVWAVAGSAGTLKFRSVRSPDLSINGSVASLNLDDFVAVADVKSATGGVIHVRRGGSVSAGKGADKFQLARNTTLYTSTADMYTWADLYQYNRLGRKWTYSDNGKTVIRQNASTVQKIGGRNVYRFTDSDGSSQTFYIDSQNRGHFLEVHDGVGSFRFSDLTLSPSVYRLGSTFNSTSKSSGSASESGLSINFSGSAAYSTRFLGHELVKTPAGTFVAVKLQSTLGGFYSGTVSNGQQSIGITVGLSMRATEYAVPGVGLVKEDNVITGKFSAPSVDESETDTDVNHHVLLKPPVDPA